MDTTEYVFAKFIAKDKQPDGTYLVKGIVSDDGLDRDEQVCDAAWLDSAVPRWFGEGGNVREMHTLSAAGKAVEYWKADDQKHWITAKVVDSGAITKVENDVLTGFSVGIKNARIVKDDHAPNGRIVDGQIIEVSLVDRPCNPRALLTLAKTDSAGHIDPVDEQVLEEPEEPEQPQPEQLPETDRAPQDAQPVFEALAGLKADGSISKADGDTEETIGGAGDALRIIAHLIELEAQGLAAGEWNEAIDISCLLEAVSALRWFVAREKSEDQGDDILLADTAKAETTDVEKAEEADDPVGLVLKSSAASDWVRGIVEKAVTEAVAKAEKDLGERLAKVEAAPTPGGPTRIRVPADLAKAEDAEKKSLLQKADEYDARAAETIDPSLRDGLRAKAQELRLSATR
jgi:hypothetical protein